MVENGIFILVNYTLVVNCQSYGQPLGDATMLVIKKLNIHVPNSRNEASLDSMLYMMASYDSMISTSYIRWFLN